MGYAVAYEPTWKRKNKRQPRPVKTLKTRATPVDKAQRRKDMRRAVRWNLAELEHDTVGTDNIGAVMLVTKLRLKRIAPDADPDGKHALQQLISEGVITKPARRSGGERVFDRETVLRELKAWAGVR